MQFISKSEEETKQFAYSFTSNLETKNDKALIIGLSGNLGTGKTTFMKYLAQCLGVKETIQSPTFVIMKKYELRNAKQNQQTIANKYKFLVHIDAYRIEKPEEMIVLDWQDVINDSQNIVCVEWPELIAEILPKHILLKFDYGQNDNERIITIKEN